MSKIITNLYLGDRNDVNNSYDLVVNCTKDIPYSTNKQKIRVPVDDTSEDNDLLLSYLPWAIQQIHTVWAHGGTILVHCFAGVSRSASVVAAYLMKYQGFRTFDDTVEFIKSKRSITFSHVNFRSAVESV
jgi:atypical dual specificity phosphatase